MHQKKMQGLEPSKKMISPPAKEKKQGNQSREREKENHPVRSPKRLKAQEVERKIRKNTVTEARGGKKWKGEK